MMRKFSDVPHHEKVVHTYHIPSTFKSSIQNGPPAYFTVAVDFGHPIFVQNVRKKTERGGKTHQCKKSKQNSSSATLNIRESTQGGDRLSAARRRVHMHFFERLSRRPGFFPPLWCCEPQCCCDQSRMSTTTMVQQQAKEFSWSKASTAGWCGGPAKYSPPPPTQSQEKVQNCSKTDANANSTYQQVKSTSRSLESPNIRF